jgi:hypothetical protein
LRLSCRRSHPGLSDFRWKEPVEPTEPLARYILRKDRLHWDKAPLKAKWKLFEPEKKREELSIYRTKGLNDKLVEALGNSEISTKEKVLGWALVTPQVLAKADPSLMIDPRPVWVDPAHPRHANIRGWDLSPEGTAKLRSIELYLAEKATIVLSSEGTALQSNRGKRP